jgi:hypothetical protein
MHSSLLYALALALSFGAMGCASRYKVDAEAPTYAALAKIRVKVNKTDNREMHLDVLHLAPPARIDPTYRGYAVWINVPGHGITKAGMLDYSEKRRRGKIVATTPHPKFEVIVSLERDLGASAPSQDVILRKIVARA